MTASSKSRWHLALKVGADACAVVGSESQTVVSTRQANPGSCPPAVVPGDICTCDICKGGLDSKETEGRDKRTLIRQCDAVLLRSQQKWQQHREVTLVDVVAEVFTRSVTSIALGSSVGRHTHATPTSQDGSVA
jgi:hypothetical protein